LAFFASALVASVTLIAAIVPAINIPGHPGTEAPIFPAPAGYLLPWAGGEIHDVTQGEETTFTHNGLSAYAFDFDLNYETVVAARSGKVTMVYAGSNSGGCSEFYSNSTNYIVIDHGDGTAGLYMHLAYDSVTVKPGDLVTQGQAIAISGETGVTCSDDGNDPGPHLHFQVERVDPDHYLTQSLPIAFDDISDNNGVPIEGNSYVSGNFGKGQPQRIKLTPHHVSREFNPQAVPLNASLVPQEPEAAASETPTDAPPTDTPTPQPLAESLITPLPTGTPEPSNTPTRTPTATPPPTLTPTPADTSTPVPPPNTPVPSTPHVPTATPAPATPEPVTTP
jgi:hypothetical protein